MTYERAEAMRQQEAGELLCQAFSDTFNGGGWADAPSWDDFDDDQKARWQLATA